MMNSNEDLSLQLTQAYPFPSGDYGGQSYSSVYQVVRTADGYDVFTGGEVLSPFTVRFFHVSGDHYIMQYGISNEHHYALVNKTPSGLVLSLHPTAKGWSQIRNNPNLSPKIDETTSTIEVDTAEVLRDFGRLNIEMTTSDPLVTPAPSAAIAAQTAPRAVCSLENVAQAICKSAPTLIALQNMKDKYMRIASALPLQQLTAFRAEQRAWHESLRNKCENDGQITDCIFVSVTKRVSDLQARQVPAAVTGIDSKIINPKPERRWGKRVGALDAKSIAVVVGISKYTGGYLPLMTASNDAQRIEKFLIEDADFDIVYLLTEDRASKQRIDRIMTDEIPQLLGERDRFLFYWSGHGDQRSLGSKTFGFLPLANSKPNEFSSMVSMEDIARWDHYLPSRQSLFVLDACFSGLAGLQTKSLSPSEILSEQLSKSSHMLMTAGTAGELAISSSRWGGSIFTDSFILGARGEAQRSYDVVTLDSLIEYIRQRVASEKAQLKFSESLSPQLSFLQSGTGVFFFEATRGR